MSAEIATEVKELEQQLSNKYKCSVRLRILINKMSLEDLYTLVDDMMREHSPYKGLHLNTKNRTTYPVLYRQLFSWFAVKMGYTQEEIAPHIAANRSTVSCSVNKLEMLLSGNDRLATSSWNEMNNKIKLLNIKI